MKDKNVVFMGTPDFAVPVLEMLIEKTNVVMVVTQPDKVVGRKKEVVYSPVKKVAIDNNIAVFQPEKIRKDYQALEKLNIDLIVTCAYGQIIPASVLALPKCGCVNVHASILPKYRGAAPIQWAIMNGEKETGVTIMFMDEGMDTGDIIKIAKVSIDEDDNVGTLHDKLAILGRDTLESVLDNLLNGLIIGIKQTDDFSLAPMIKREDERLNFKDTGVNIINKIRAFNPWPLANIIIDNKEYKIVNAKFVSGKSKSCGRIVDIDKNSLGISCKDGTIYIKRIKPFGKKEMDINSFLNGIDINEYKNKEVN